MLQTVPMLYKGIFRFPILKQCYSLQPLKITLGPNTCLTWGKFANVANSSNTLFLLGWQRIWHAVKQLYFCRRQRLAEGKDWPKAKAGRRLGLAKGKGWPKAKAGRRQRLAEGKGSPKAKVARRLNSRVH